MLKWSIFARLQPQNPDIIIGWAKRRRSLVCSSAVSCSTLKIVYYFKLVPSQISFHAAEATVFFKPLSETNHQRSLARSLQGSFPRSSMQQLNRCSGIADTRSTGFPPQNVIAGVNYPVYNSSSPWRFGIGSLLSLTVPILLPISFSLLF